uniref:ANF_receptor domain-containing protein n=1 Tax=Loa loa TaxID=7209 RepID=A0A1I7V862_LOALO
MGSYNCLLRTKLILLKSSVFDKCLTVYLQSSSTSSYDLSEMPLLIVCSVPLSRTRLLYDTPSGLSPSDNNQTAQSGSAIPKQIKDASFPIVYLAKIAGEAAHNPSMFVGVLVTVTHFMASSGWNYSLKVYGVKNKPSLRSAGTNDIMTLGVVANSKKNENIFTMLQRFLY